uniref:Uncharacterized protein n=1 Tax=Anguilla anguilla TaxID=7936 RepID=A0A0E9PMJ2_ANGAN
MMYSALRPTLHHLVTLLSLCIICFEQSENLCSLQSYNFAQNETFM